LSVTRSADILAEFGLLSGHPWAETAASPLTTYYACLHDLVRRERARRVLEIGTGFGLSGAAILAAMEEIEFFVSVDLGTLGANNVSFARERLHAWCRRRGVPVERVRVVHAGTQPGDEPRWTPDAASFDVVFIDGRHTGDALYNDLSLTWTLLRPGGLAVCDDLHDERFPFEWAGQTTRSFERFAAERAGEIAARRIWEEPRVPPEGASGLRPFGLLRKRGDSDKIVLPMSNEPPGLQTPVEPQLDVTTALELHAKALLPPLKALSDCVAAPQEFAFSDWLMMGAMALEFKPDFVTEIGRGSGGTTAMLLEVMSRLKGEIFSVESQTSGWDQVEPKLRERQPESWFAPLVLMDAPASGLEFDRHLPPGSRRILLVCSYQTEEWLRTCVDRLFPILKGRENLVVVRGVSDLRGEQIARSSAYSTFGTFQAPTKSFGVLHDWLAANRVTVGSPPADIVAAMHRNPRRWNALRRALLGQAYPLVGAGGHWIYFRVPRG